MSTFTPARRTGKRDKFIPAVKKGKRDVFIPAIRPARQCEPGFTPAKRSSSKGQVFVPAKRPASGTTFVPAKRKSSPDTTAQAHPLITHPYLVGKLSGSDIVHEEFGVDISKLPLAPLSSMRGVSYPGWYNGFMRNTEIRIVKKRDYCDVRCRVLFGPNRRQPLAKTKPLKFNKMSDHSDLEEASAWFFQGAMNGGTTNRENMEIFWPDQLNSDIFDHIWLERADDNSGEPLLIKKVEIVLNEICICRVVWPRYNTVSNYLDLSPHIERDRQDALRYRDNPNSMLKLLAGELGQAWSPKYGSKWLKFHFDNPDRFVFTPHPRNWCDDFANWAMFTNGKIENYSSWYHDIDVMTERLIENNYFILPYNTPYPLLRNYVKPGYYANPHRHATFFLYWVPPVPSAEFSYSRLYDESNITESLRRYKMVLENHCPEKIGDGNLFQRGHFQPQNDLNWFCHISGSSGDRVRIGVSAVIRLGDYNDQKKDVRDWFKGVENGKFIPWFEHENLDMNQTLHDGYRLYHGFCRTDGTKNPLNLEWETR
ncbi:MAG TPA: hypothetical protein PKW95_10905 [bacterium]|nr:hypothetical protein [bacterium]